MKKNRIFSPLVTVASDQNSSSQATPFILPQALLKHQQNFPDSYRIEKLQEVSDKFSQNEAIFILAHDVNADFPAHSHDFFEMTYVYRGEIKNVIDGNEFYMIAGDLSVLNPNAIQEIKYQVPDTLLLNFCLKPSAFNRTLQTFYQDDNPLSSFFRGAVPDRQNYMFFSTGYNLTIQSILSSLIPEYIESGFHQTFALEAWFLLLFTHLVRINEYSYYGINEHAREIIRYLRANCIKYTLNDIAKQLGYNPSYLTTLIKKHTGRNCKNIIQEVKLNKAFELLENSDLNLYQISEECGYASPSHFFRLFRERFGLTPGEYRKKSKL